MPDAPVAPAVNPTATAENITKAIQDGAAGKLPVKADPKAVADPKAPAAPPDQNAGKKKYVVNGKDVYLTPEQADAYVQKGIAFEPKVSELARVNQETAKFLELLKTSPEKILFNPKVGHTPEAILDRILSSDSVSDAIKEKLGRWYYENVFQRSKLTDEQRKALDNERELAKLKQKDLDAADEAVRQENAARVAKVLAQVKAQIAEAMKDAGLPNGDSALAVQVARRVADVMRVANKAGKAMTPKEAIERVRKEFREIQKGYYDVLDPEKLVEELGPENAEKIRKHLLKLVKPAEELKGPKAPSVKKGERQIISPDEMADYLENLKKNG